MTNKKIDAVQVWKQVEDQLVPRLRLDLNGRAVYYNLLRHSRLEGRVRLRFSILWLARHLSFDGDGAGGGSAAH